MAEKLYFSGFNPIFMSIKHFHFKIAAAIVFLVFTGSIVVQAQVDGAIRWTKDGNHFYQIEEGEIFEIDAASKTKPVLVISKSMLTPAGKTAIGVKRFSFSEDGASVLIMTNTKKVWRSDTRGDYWVYNRNAKTLNQVGKNLPVSSLMFAKFSPDGKKVGFVSEHNIYVEDLATKSIKKLTNDGTKKLINGTFDWAYEEEFFCRDGFRWSPDSRQIAYWQIDARKTKNYLMLNTTDSIYPFVVPVEYPVAGEAPSPFKIGVINVASGNTKWMDIPTDPLLQSYVPRMEWAANSSELIIQHLNRQQNKSNLMLCNTGTGKSQSIYEEKDEAWIDILPLWDDTYAMGGWNWLNKGAEFLWVSEKDGWRHLYRVGRDGKHEKLITNGNYDIMDISAIDEQSGYVYFLASPDNATQKYLYRTKLDGSGKAERLSPANQQGTHEYDVSPNGSMALHSFSNYFTPPAYEVVTLPDHKGIDGAENVNKAIAAADKSKSTLEFIKVKTEDGVEIDTWMQKPANFDPSKKYPVLFYVYGEPWGQNVKDEYGITNTRNVYNGDIAKDGYVYVAMDNRGTPVPKGRAWRKAIYRNIGLLNIRDQAMTAKELLKLPYLDTSRVAVWGWSGGGSSTLNLMFQYPDIFKTGIAIAAVGYQLSYDNIYQERYMGVPTTPEGRAYLLKGSPITYAKNLRGNLLYIHGTGDDNVHYQNAEMLIDELVKYNKQFQLMSYPNRTHSISEGEGTSLHLSTLFTNYLKEHCPPGAR